MQQTQQRRGDFNKATRQSILRQPPITYQSGQPTRIQLPNTGFLGFIYLLFTGTTTTAAASSTTAENYIAPPVGIAFHWVMAVSMLVLLFTAFLPIVGVRFAWVQWHWMAGLLLTASILFHIVHATFFLDFWSIWVGPKDIPEFKAEMMREMGHEDAAGPRPGKYPLGNRLYHLAVMVAGAGCGSDDGTGGGPGPGGGGPGGGGATGAYEVKTDLCAEADLAPLKAVLPAVDDLKVQGKTLNGSPVFYCDGTAGKTDQYLGEGQIAAAYESAFTAAALARVAREAAELDNIYYQQGIGPLVAGAPYSVIVWCPFGAVTFLTRRSGSSACVTGSA